MRKILFLTGSRSDYDILHAVITAVKADARLEALVAVTGAHLSAAHGETIAQVVRDGHEPVARIDSLLASDRPGGRAKSAAIQLASVVDAIDRLRPDILFAAMDREEALSLAIAGSYLRLPIFHLGGGDVTGDGIDDRVREAVSALAHIHLTHTEAAGRRLVARGEPSWRVHPVGAPGLDRWRGLGRTPTPALWDHLRVPPDPRPYVIVLQHPEFGESPCAHLVLEALLDFDLPVWIGSPNSDPGSEAVREANVDFCRRFPHRFRSYGNLPRPLFAQLLGGAAALIGNSSCGVIEAPFLGVPVVDLGRRQAGRDGSERLIHAPYDREAIAAAIHRALTAAAQPRPSPGGSAYGDGRAGPRIARLLAEIPLGARLLDKRETTGDSR